MITVSDLAEPRAGCACRRFRRGVAQATPADRGCLSDSRSGVLPWVIQARCRPGDALGGFVTRVAQAALRVSDLWFTFEHVPLSRSPMRSPTTDGTAAPLGSRREAGGSFRTDLERRLPRTSAGAQLYGLHAQHRKSFSRSFGGGACAGFLVRLQSSGGWAGGDTPCFAFRRYVRRLNEGGIPSCRGEFLRHPLVASGRVRSRTPASGLDACGGGSARTSGPLVMRLGS